MDLYTNGAFSQVARQSWSFAGITDGLSNTLLVGEKHVPLRQWGVGWWDCSLYNGDYATCSTRPAGPDYPLARSPWDQGVTFGSYHPNLCQFSFADGSVRPLSIDIEPRILGLLANREDGQHIPNY